MRRLVTWFLFTVVAMGIVLAIPGEQSSGEIALITLPLIGIAMIVAHSWERTR